MAQKSLKVFVGRNIQDLATPAFCVDLDVVKNNCAKMIKISQNVVINLRPHMKTHKTVEAGTLMTGGTRRSIVVSTLAEAEFFADHDFDDILYAYPLTQKKFERCIVLNHRLEQFHIMLDNEFVLDQLETFIDTYKNPSSKKLSVFLELDCGYHRSGVEWDKLEGQKIAMRLSQSHHLTFAGVYVHCGNSYNVQETGCTVAGVQKEAISRILDFVKRLKNSGIDCPVVGVGSTPSCSQPIPEWSSLTEMHPGNYVFYDAQQYLLGSCRIDEIACYVATTVIGCYPDRNELVIDCGFTGLTKQGKDALPGGFVIFKDEPKLKLKEMTQELGKVTSTDGAAIDFRNYPIGTVLFMYPYHSCATAAMYDHYFGHSKKKIVEIWEPCRGW